jgi:hypothetical protein
MFQRYALWFPVTLVVGGTDARRIWSICRDASAGGIQVSSVTPLAVGTAVSAQFRVARDAELDRTVEAEVIRSEINDGELMLAFPFRIALRFLAAVPELPDELTNVGLEATR